MLINTKTPYPFLVIKPGSCFLWQKLRYFIGVSQISNRPDVWLLHCSGIITYNYPPYHSFAISKHSRNNYGFVPITTVIKRKEQAPLLFSLDDLLFIGPGYSLAPGIGSNRFHCDGSGTETAGRPWIRACAAQLSRPWWRRSPPPLRYPLRSLRWSLCESLWWYTGLRLRRPAIIAVVAYDGAWCFQLHTLFWPLRSFKKSSSS